IEIGSRACDLDEFLLVRNCFGGLGGALALVAAQIHSRNRINIFFASLDILVTEGRGLHQLLVQLFKLRALNPPEDVVSGEIALQVGRPGEIDKWLLAHAGENRLQSGGLARRINVTGEDLNRLRIVTLDRGVDAMRIDLGKRGDAIFVLLLPCKSVVEIRSTGRRSYIGQPGVGGSANWLPHDAIAVAQT